MVNVKGKLNKLLNRYLKYIKYQFFTKKITILKWQLNVFAIALLTIGLITGVYASATGIIKLVKAWNETTYSITHTGDTELTWGSSNGTVVTTSNISLDKNTNWFNLNWNYKRPLKIKNTSGSTLHTGSSITINIDSSALEQVLANCNDIRVTYQSTNELPLKVVAQSNNCQTSKVTTLTFPIRADIASGAEDTTNYALFYGNSGASAPVSTAGYSIEGGPSATMVCSFSSSTTCETGQTPSTSTGAIRYSGKSALSFDGNSDYVTIPDSSSLDSQYMTVEAWVYPKEFVSGASIYNRRNISNVGGVTMEFSSPTGNVSCYFYISGAWRWATVTGTIKNAWNHIACSYDGTTIRGFLNGQMATPVSYSGTINSPSSPSVIIGKNGPGAYYFNGMMDELRVSNISRYSNTFTPQTPPFIRDANTTLLYHFDENGSDPRNTGKVLDDSGNGNNGTITGATYVSGLVGVDSNAVQSQITNQSFASHQGVFVEEGTTNRVKNPSFETNITDSWTGKSNINFTTSQVDADGNALVGSNNIKDVFFYDTTKDSDGGAWRNSVSSQSKSWYTEAFSTTRGKKKEFPEKAYIISEGSGASIYVDIIDAIENKLWMRFIPGAGYYLENPSFVNSVQALNGVLFIGASDASNGYLAAIDYKNEYGDYTNTTNSRRHAGNISQRNSSTALNALNSVALINRAVNDVSVQVISGKTYVAVATDGGVSVINETDSTVVNDSTSTGVGSGVSDVFLTPNGTLYYSRKVSYGLLYVKYLIQNAVSSFNASKIYSPVVNAAYVSGVLIPEIYSTRRIYVTQGTSTIDGTSNTIYLGGGSQGMTVIQEKQGDESHGSIKNYDKNHITEEMIGAIQGQWGFWEDTSTDANQFKASGYLDTGKLNQSISMYGNSAGTAGSTLTFNRGAQISGNNYEHINTNQGTISFWFKPSWDRADGKEHSLFSDGSGSQKFAIFKAANGNFGGRIPSNTEVNMPTATPTITSGNWYLVTLVWSKNTVDGTNYGVLYLNNSLVSQSTTSLTPQIPVSTYYIGGHPLSGAPAQALIDDFAIFDRVLSTTEIAAIYGNGTSTMSEAGYIADSSLKFYSKMDGSGTLQPVTYNGGASASKTQAASSELTGGMNKVLNGRFQVDVNSDGLADSWVSNGGTSTFAAAETANILFDARSQKVTAYASNDGIKQDISVTAGEKYTFSAWVKSDGTNNVEVRLYDITNAAYIDGLAGQFTTNSSTWVQTNRTFMVPAGCTSVRVWLFSGSALTFSFYLGSATLTPNLVDNGGMEGQYTATGSAIYTSTTSQVRSGSGPYVYTETGKFATGLAGLIATDGTNFGYITASDANSVTVNFTGGSGTIATNAVLDVKNALVPGWTSNFGNGKITRESSSFHSGTYAVKQNYGTSGAPSISKVVTVVGGQQYLLNFWTRGDGTNSGFYEAYDISHSASITGFKSTAVSGTTYVKKSIIFTIPSGCTSLGIYLYVSTTNGASTYFDDVSLTLLDNVSLSFKSWASASDSSAIGSSLSVQGNATGVQSLASGVRNTALTFDGSTGYLRQQTIATNVGTLSYATGNDTTTAQFEDDGMDFSTYQTTSGNASYMIVITNSDNTTTWGYLGTASGSGNKDIQIYTTKARATRGWGANGSILPIGGAKVPVGYEIRKTDFQITGAMSFGAWIKTSDTYSIPFSKEQITSNGNGISGSRGFELRIQNNSNGGLGITNFATSGDLTSYIDGNWHYYIGVFNPSTELALYIDGSKALSNTNAVPSSLVDTSDPVTIGGPSNLIAAASSFFNGSIDEPFITADVLSASQILDMYNKGLGALNHATKSDQKLQGTTSNVQSVWGSSDGTTIYAGTDTALSIIKNGKVGNYTDSDSVVKSLTTATTPALLSNNTVAMDIVNSSQTTPTMIVGSSASGVTALNAALGTVSQDSTTPRFGTKSLLLDNTSSSLDQIYSMTDTLTAASYTMSFYAYKDGTQLTSSDVLPIGSTNPIAGLPSSTVTYEDVGGGWTRVKGVFTADTVSNQVFGIQVRSGKKIYVDGVQLENKSYATTYADGSLGSNYAWTGTANNSTSNRTVVNLKYSPTGNISSSQGSISLWVKFKNLGNSWQYILNNDANPGANWGLFWYGTNLDFRIADSGNTTNANVYRPLLTSEVGNWHHVVATWDNTQNSINMIKDGNLAVSPTTTSFTYGGFSSTLSIGNANNLYLGNVEISDLRIFNAALNSNQITDLYNSGLISHSDDVSNQVKYLTTGTWESPVMSLASNAHWGSSPNFLPTETLNGNTINYDVRTSIDGVTWSNYQANTGTDPNYSITPNALKYVQVRATLNSPSQLTTPILSGMNINYVKDLVAPSANAANTIMLRSAGGINVPSMTWTNNSSPYFSWDQGADANSGLRGYCLSLSQQAGVDPINSKGNLLGTSPVTTVDSTCQFVVGTNSIDFSNVALRGSTWLTTSDQPYYLRIRAIDNVGNVYNSGLYEEFAFKFDDTPPTNVTSISAPNNSFSNVNDIYFNWPISGTSQASDANSQLLGYQYSINSENNWLGTDHSNSLGMDYIPLNTTLPYYLTDSRDKQYIQTGNNTIYFKALDIAGNKSQLSRTALIAYGGDAPKFADGSIVTITPNTSTINSFSLSWPSATLSPGRTVKSYYYMVNVTPPGNLSTLRSNSLVYIPSLTTSVPESKINGLVKGSNTIYVVVVDDLDNYSQSNVISGTLTLNSTLPD
ncbi:MAG: LamG-like jellyroll fold domain-containing protein, partial [bacterium]